MEMRIERRECAADSDVYILRLRSPRKQHRKGQTDTPH
jgi:hypothetical protein